MLQKYEAALRLMAAVLGVFRDVSLNLLVQAGFISVTEGIEKVHGWIMGSPKM